MSAAPIAVAGPFTGVRTITDAPYTDWQRNLQFAQNGYFPDPNNPSSWLSRPGFTLKNPSAQMGTGQRMQGTVPFVDPTTGTIYRFFVVNGKLYRSNSTFTTFTDVSPVGIGIDNATATRVSFAAVGSSLVVTDGVNRPWVMSNYASTPVTGTYIDIDGAGGSWTAFGKPTIYQDSVFFIALTVPGGSAVTPRIGIVWSEPNRPTVGYTQTDYADYWNLIETGSDPLYAILGTNNGLFYWRESSIGMAAGTPSINFSTTATRDSRSTFVGTISPWAIAQFANNVFFLDVRGRPWMMPLDGDPQPIWQQLPSVTQANATGLLPATLSYLAVGAIVPEINHYMVAIGGDPTSTTTNQAQLFNGASGAYAGQWDIRIGTPAYDVIDEQRDASGVRVLCVGGGASSTATSGGYVWILEALQAGIFADSDSIGRAIALSVSTGLVGYTADRILYPDYVTLILRSNFLTANAVLSVGIINQDGSQTTVSNVTTGINAGINKQVRAVVGLDGTARRWLLLNVTLTTAAGASNLASQWGVDRIEVFGSTGMAGPDDP